MPSKTWANIRADSSRQPGAGKISGITFLISRWDDKELETNDGNRPDAVSNINQQQHRFAAVFIRYQAHRLTGCYCALCGRAKRTTAAFLIFYSSFTLLLGGQQKGVLLACCYLERTTTPNSCSYIYNRFQKWSLNFAWTSFLRRQALDAPSAAIALPFSTKTHWCVLFRFCCCCCWTTVYRCYYLPTKFLLFGREILNSFSQSRAHKIWAKKTYGESTGTLRAFGVIC